MGIGHKDKSGKFHPHSNRGSGISSNEFSNTKKPNNIKISNYSRGGDITGEIDPFNLEEIARYLANKGKIDDSMSADDIIKMYKKVTGNNVYRSNALNPIYRGYFSSKPEATRRKEWESKTKKQRYDELRNIATHDWAEKYSVKNWSELSKDEKHFLESAYRDLARLETARARQHNMMNDEVLNHE